MAKLTTSDLKHIIVQAGGQGSRMNHHTWNKPKCLLTLEGQTLLDRILDVFPGARIWVIGDYQITTLTDYLRYQNNPRVTLTHSELKSTSAGIPQVLTQIPQGEALAVVWSDLWWTRAPEFEITAPVGVAVTDRFPCGWSIDDQEFTQTPGDGVLGFYVFENKQILTELDETQPLVEGFLRSLPRTDIQTWRESGCEDLGTQARYEQLIAHTPPGRWFNQLVFHPDQVEKHCEKPDYQHLIDQETAWYQRVSGQSVRTPQLLGTQPLRLSRIAGVHPTQSSAGAEKIFSDLADQLTAIHSLEQGEVNSTSCWQMYQQKPWQRSQKMSWWIPGWHEPEIQINGVWCKNPWRQLDHYQRWVATVTPSEFRLIHGDPTLNNCLVDDQNQVWLIDPRGAFGESGLLGDACYDWAKVYYDLVENYSQIDQGGFSVRVCDREVTLAIRSQGWEHLEPEILARSGVRDPRHLKFITATIWLSLTAWAWPNRDAVMYAWYQGVRLWNQVNS